MKKFVLQGMCCLALLVMMSGCVSSRKTGYLYQLEPLPLADRNVASLQITHVTLPGYLKRLEMIRRRNSCQLEISRYGRWCDPLNLLLMETMNRMLQESGNSKGKGSTPCRVIFHNFELAPEGFLLDGEFYLGKGGNPQHIVLVLPPSKVSVGGTEDVRQAKLSSQALQKFLSEVLKNLK